MKQLINSIKKILTTGGLFVLILFLTYKIVFAKMNFSELANTLSIINPVYLTWGVLSIVFMICAECYNMKRNLKLLGENKTFFQCLIYTFTGNFFSAITPSATGGQPMQLFFMCKDGIPASKGTLALLMDLGTYQIAIVTTAITGYLLCFKMINRSLGAFIPILWIGLVLNLALLFITFTTIFSEKFIFKLVTLLTKLVGIFSKQKAAAFNNWMLKGVSQYKLSSNVLRENKRFYVVNAFITLMRIIAMHSAPFWIYKSFGLTGINFFQMLSLQAALYISCAVLPFPGGVGIGESTFLLYFKEVFSSSIIASAMVLSRGIGLYSVVFICGLSLGAFWLIVKNKKTIN